ncbi:MAG: diadenylate cyclase, partial [Muribaculaceae bacterium]|nr:diadenylate cyclase [Muribaculaceae bacterium]
MIDFGIKDIIDIILVALLLYYLYRVMKKSGTINIFVGILSIIGVWIVTSGIFEMKLTGTILDKFMNIGLIVLVILFQDQIKRFLVDLGSQNKWRAIRRLIFRQEETSEENHADIMTIVYSCMNMAKTKTGALIVIQRKMPLSDYEKTGDEINANI